ncbi:MAG: prepilin-type N-terminal cleavage/methylation domain-containing protein [Bacilli bacterium]|nr:prepilin-type N-terminal cleavage/methylation domain-containing protein [Bacilli bacterium]
MRRKGFTLVELLGVITILAVLALIVAVPVTKTIQEGNKKACESQVSNIEESAKLWGADHKDRLPSTLDASIHIDLGTLKRDGFADKDLKNPVNKEFLSDELLITITKKGNKYWSYTLVDGKNLCGNDATTSSSYVKDGLLIRYDGLNAPIKKGSKIVWQDLSGKGNDATLSAGFGSSINSFWNASSLVLDGQDDYLSVKNPLYSGAGSTHPITIEVISEKGSKNTYAMVFSTTDSINSYHYLNLWTTMESTRSYEVYFTSKKYWDGVLVSPAVPAQALSMKPADVPLNKKHAISFGASSTNYFAYLNGDKKYNQAISAALGFYDEEIFIGKGHRATSATGVPYPDQYYPFDGRIYSVRVYDRALTDAEVKQNYDLDKKRFNL